MADDAAALLRALASVDPRAAAWCACQCAKTTLHLVGESEQRFVAALEVAEAWAQGRATVDDCHVACDAASEDIDSLGATDAAVAVASLFTAAKIPTAPTPEDAANAGEAVVLTAATACALPTDGTWRQRHQAHLLCLRNLVVDQRWPMTVPTHDELLEAPAEVAVAWDWLEARSDQTLTVVALVEAHARADRLSLDWTDPVQRAVAERAVDEQRVRSLLGARPSRRP